LVCSTYGFTSRCFNKGKELLEKMIPAWGKQVDNKTFFTNLEHSKNSLNLKA